jgi:ferredoxin
MPKVTIKDVGTFDVDEGERLVNAISQEADVDIGHRCGGHASCTTCRVTFDEGEPDVMTRAEFDKLHDINQYGNFRLSCQIVVDRPMTVEPLMRASEKGWDDAGPQPEIEVEPEPEWFPIAELEAERESA